MRRSILLACLALGLLAADCGGEELGHQEAIEQLKNRISVGMSRGEVEGVLSEINAHYYYVPRNESIARHEGRDEPAPISGWFQVTLPPDKRLLAKTVGHVFIELDKEERVVNLRIDRMDVPR